MLVQICVFVDICKCMSVWMCVYITIACIILEAGLLYNSICHNVTMSVRKPFTLELHNFSQGGPIFTEIGMWPPVMILNILTSWPLTSEVRKLKMEVKIKQSILTCFLRILYVRLFGDSQSAKGKRREFLKPGGGFSLPLENQEGESPP